MWASNFQIYHNSKIILEKGINPIKKKHFANRRLNCENWQHFPASEFYHQEAMFKSQKCLYKSNYEN